MTGLNLLLLAVLVTAFPLASCSWIEKIRVPEQVKVQVPVACVDPARRPQKPVLRSEADLMALDTYRRTIAAWSDFKKLEAYNAELEAIVEACSRITVPSGSGPPTSS